MAKKIKIIKNENNTTLEKTEINQNKNTFKKLLDRYSSSQITTKYIFDLQTLYLLRQNRILNTLNKRYQYVDRNFCSITLIPRFHSLSCMLI